MQVYKGHCAVVHYMAVILYIKDIVVAYKGVYTKSRPFNPQIYSPRILNIKIFESWEQISGSLEGLDLYRYLYIISLKVCTG